MQETQCAGPEALEEARVLPQKLEELGEGALGDMGERCRAAGLQSLFLRALKIDREPC
jgi:hypothetical protein